MDPKVKEKAEACLKKGEYFPTPIDAMKYGRREELLYVVTVQPRVDEEHGDYVTTIDVNPESPTYSTIIHRTFTNKPGNELHHSGWNSCSACCNVKPADQCEAAKLPKRTKLIMPALHSNRVYVFDTAKDPRKPVLYKEIDGFELTHRDVSAPHTIHCLPDGTVLISTMGDGKDNAKGDFIQFDADFNCLGTWVRGSRRAQCGYDFWYQPFFDVMVASEWSAPKLFKRGWSDKDASNKKEVGHHLNFYRWSDHTLVQTIDLGEEGMTPLEVRFVHDPQKVVGYVGCALNANVYRFWRPDEDVEKFEVKKVIDIPPKRIRDAKGNVKDIGGMMGDILLSLDDRWLYLTNWMHGDVRQYDLSDPDHPRLSGQVFLGGLANPPPGTKIIVDHEISYQPRPTFFGSRRLEGAPQMLQLSLDGLRLYVSSSLYSPWDKQFYPKMVEKGGHIVQLDCDIEKGGLKLNKDFFIDFGSDPYGPGLPHEMRYPGGDCTSDIWLPEKEKL